MLLIIPFNKCKSDVTVKGEERQLSLKRMIYVRYEFYVYLI